jgi:hypothetical protein
VTSGVTGFVSSSGSGVTDCTEYVCGNPFVSRYTKLQLRSRTHAATHITMVVTHSVMMFHTDSCPVTVNMMACDTIKQQNMTLTRRASSFDTRPRSAMGNKSKHSVNSRCEATALNAVAFLLGVAVHDASNNTCVCVRAALCILPLLQAIAIRFE